MDTRTRKLITMHNALHPRSNVDRLYIPRGEVGRGFLCIEDAVNLAKLRLEEYVKMSDERLVSAARGADEATNWEAAVEAKHEFKRWKNTIDKATGKQRYYTGSLSLRQNI